EGEIAELLRRKGELAGAIAAAEKSLTLDNELGSAYQSLGLALRAASAAQKHSPNHWASEEASRHFDNGRDLLSRGDTEGAKKEFERAVEASPNFAEAHNLLGFVLGQLGDFPVALEHLRNAVKLAPLLAAARYNLGVALWYDGNSAEARSELETSIKLDPALGELMRFLEWSAHRRKIGRS